MASTQPTISPVELSKETPSLPFCSPHPPLREEEPDPGASSAGVALLPSLLEKQQLRTVHVPPYPHPASQAVCSLNTLFPTQPSPRQVGVHRAGARIT